MRAIKSVKLYPLQITTEAEACALEGVGSFTARRMLRGLAAQSVAINTAGNKNAPCPSNRSGTLANSSGICHFDEENVEPQSGPSRGGRKGKNALLSCARKPQPAGSERSSSSNAEKIVNPYGEKTNTAYRSAAPSQRAFSLAASLSVLREEEGGEADGSSTADVTPRRPTSRARMEGVGETYSIAMASEAPRFFSGRWEAWLIVDNREHEFMSVQVRVGKYMAFLVPSSLTSKMSANRFWLERCLGICSVSGPGSPYSTRCIVVW